MLPIHGHEFDAVSHGRWRARLTREPELPPVGTDQIACIVEFEPVGAKAPLRTLVLRLSYVGLSHSSYDPHDSKSYQQQIFTACTDWLKTDQVSGDLSFFGV
jgi:hypothetical protein